MLLRNSLFLAILICILGTMGACRKDLVLLTEKGTLQFSTDTVYFDTVFTRLPGSNYPRSINKQFMVRNPYSKTINLNARIGGGSASEYRMNIDGRSGNQISEIEILPKDSVWVFVECTLEPNNLTQPAIVRDSIIFETNGNNQFIQLAAYGWDAYYFKDTVLDNTNWTNTDKPYVLVNYCIVDENKTLTIGPGVHIYSSTNSYFLDTLGKKNFINALNVLGTLKINGTNSNPVIFEGDRLDNNFSKKEGQWQGIGFFRTSINNELTHCIIKNATVGVRVDSLSNNASPKLLLKNCIIQNMSGIGIWGRTGSITAINTVVSNCAIATFYGQYGGEYSFNHCSFSNYFSSGRDPQFVLNNIMRDENKVVIRTFPIVVGFLNCIIWGNNESEIGADLTAPLPANAFKNCLIKNKTSLPTNNILNKNPLFVNASENNLKLSAGSPAIDTAYSTVVTTDLNDKTRDSKPDIGAYEY